MSADVEDHDCTCDENGPCSYCDSCSVCSRLPAANRRADEEQQR